MPSPPTILLMVLDICMYEIGCGVVAMPLSSTQGLHSRGFEIGGLNGGNEGIARALL